MSAQIPKTMRALTQDEGKPMKMSIKEIPTPEIGDNQVLIKVEYTAQNPTDWKHAAFYSPPGAINGCDYSGTVVKLGPNLKIPLHIGDKVAGTVHGGQFQDEGSNAEYAKIYSDLCFKVPEGLKMEEAATFAVGWVTSYQALIKSPGRSFPPIKVPENTWYIIYGAASSVGLFATSLATAMGYRVLGVASPHSFDLIKSYGAEEVVSYHEPEKAIADAMRITGGGVEYALNTISDGETFTITIKMMGDKGKQLNSILPPPEAAHKVNPKVKLADTIMYDIFGIEFEWPKDSFTVTHYPARPDMHAFGKEVFKNTPDLITKYGVKPNPIQIRGTMDDIIAGHAEMIVS